VLIRQYSTSSLYRRVLLPVLWRVVRRSLFGANLIALWAMLRIFLRRAVVWLPTKLHERRVGVEELLEDVPHRQEVFTIPKRLLNFHPHVHVLVTDGGFLPNGTFGPLAWFDSRHVERLFRAEVLRMLLEKELITEAIVDNLLSWRHSGFSAHGAVRVEDRELAPGVSAAT